jgi:hypothetical protein
VVGCGAVANGQHNTRPQTLAASQSLKGSACYVIDFHSISSMIILVVCRRHASVPIGNVQQPLEQRTWEVCFLYTLFTNQCLDVDYTFIPRPNLSDASRNQLYYDNRWTKRDWRDQQQQPAPPKCRHRDKRGLRVMVGEGDDTGGLETRHISSLWYVSLLFYVSFFLLIYYLKQNRLLRWLCTSISTRLSTWYVSLLFNVSFFYWFVI